MKPSNSPSPDPGRELRNIRNLLALEKETLLKIENEELVVLNKTAGNENRCNCDSYYLKQTYWPPASQNVSENSVCKKNEKPVIDKMVHSSECPAVLKRQGSYSSDASYRSMGHSFDSYDSDDSYDDLSKVFDPLKSRNKKDGFQIYTIDLDLYHTLGFTARYNSIVEFLSTSASVLHFTELVVNPKGNTLCLEQSTLDAFYKFIWSFINDPQVDKILEQIHNRAISPYQLACRYGYQTYFNRYFTTAHWDQFQRIFPDWSFPIVTDGEISHRWYYTTPLNYGRGN